MGGDQGVEPDVWSDPPADPDTLDRDGHGTAGAAPALGSTIKLLKVGSHRSISVVIPTYNKPASSGRRSTACSTRGLADFEVVVVDDGSTDETPEFVAGYGDRVRVIRQENAGESSARNAGILAARRLVALLDSDNRWLEGKLRRQMELLEDPAPDFTFTAYTRFGDVHVRTWSSMVG